MGGRISPGFAGALAATGDTPIQVMFQVFDVLHLDGRSTRALTYRERRALLEELALDGPAWRTPASVSVDWAEDFVSRVGELGLEGVVAKRLGSSYLPGRRSRAWIKHKLRREEHLAVTGLRRSRDGTAEAVFVARRLPDGSFTGAGSIELGLRADVVHELERRLGDAPRSPPRRDRVVSGGGVSDRVCPWVAGRSGTRRRAARDRRGSSTGYVELSPPSRESTIWLRANHPIGPQTSDSANPRTHRRDAPTPPQAHLLVRSLAPIFEDVDQRDRPPT